MDSKIRYHILKNDEQRTQKVIIVKLFSNITALASVPNLNFVIS